MVKVFDKATTDDYVTSDVADMEGMERLLVYIKNTHGSNNIKFKIIATPDRSLATPDEEVLQPETTLAPGASWYDSIIQPWESIWFEIKNATAGQNASARAYTNMKRV